MNFLYNMKDKVALVTGGSKGYGKGIASALVDKGIAVWITGRNESALKNTALELKCNYLKADVTSSADWQMLLKKIIDTHGRLDILINNAGGGGKIANCDQQSTDDIKSTIAVNLTGSIFGCHFVSSIMKKQKSGTIINISSICAREAWAGWGVYSAAKAGLLQFSKSLYVELREYNVKVTSIIPSWGNTCFNANANIPEFDKATAEKCIKPEDMGKQVLNICMLPAHICIQDITVLPLIQEINPL